MKRQEKGKEKREQENQAGGKVGENQIEGKWTEPVDSDALPAAVHPSQEEQEARGDAKPQRETKQSATALSITIKQRCKQTSVTILSSVPPPLDSS